MAATCTRLWAMSVSPSRLEIGQQREHVAQVAPPGPSAAGFADLPVEGDQPHRVLLVDHQVAERGRQADRVIELGQLLPIGVAHRTAQVHHQVAGDVGLGLELLDVILVGLGVDQPVDVLRIVAGRVFAVFAELDREAVERAGVQPVQKALHDELRARSSRLIWRITSGFRYFSAVDTGRGFRDLGI